MNTQERLCDLCNERPAKATLRDKQGHVVRLCYRCNITCGHAKLKVKDILARMAEKQKEANT